MKIDDFDLIFLKQQMSETKPSCPLSVLEREVSVPYWPDVGYQEYNILVSKGDEMLFDTLLRKCGMYFTASGARLEVSCYISKYGQAWRVLEDENGYWVCGMRWVEGWRASMCSFVYHNKATSEETEKNLSNAPEMLKEEIIFSEEYFELMWAISCVIRFRISSIRQIQKTLRPLQTASRTLLFTLDVSKSECYVLHIQVCDTSAGGCNCTAQFKRRLYCTLGSLRRRVEYDYAGVSVIKEAKTLVSGPNWEEHVAWDSEAAADIVKSLGFCPNKVMSSFGPPSHCD